MQCPETLTCSRTPAGIALNRFRRSVGDSLFRPVHHETLRFTTGGPRVRVHGPSLGCVRPSCERPPASARQECGDTKSRQTKTPDVLRPLEDRKTVPSSP